VRWLFVLVAVTGCADLPPLELGTCGNGILDPGEDCDTHDARCVACAWTCDDLDCSGIPAPRDGHGYACGAEHVCHAPGGVLATTPTTNQELAVQTIFITDVDRDHYGDVVGVSADAIVSRFGDPAGKLERETATVIPTVGGPIAIADLDGDKARDVLVPARDGLVAFASPQHAMSPFALTVELAGVGNLQLRALFSIDGKRLGVLVDDPRGSGHLVGAIVDITTRVIMPMALPLCDSTYQSATFDPSLADFHDTTGVPAKPSVGVTFIATSDTTGQPQLCAINIEEDSPTSFSFNVGPPDFPATSHRPVLAEVDDSTCPSIIDSDDGPAQLARRPGYRDVNGRCTLGLPVAMPAIAAPSSDAVVGRVRLSPAIAGAAPDALVLTSGIYDLDTTAHPIGQLYSSDRALTSSASGDIDADGNTDGVALGLDQTIDVLYRTTQPDGFFRVRIATDALPSHLAVADFDGNGADDIAFTEPQATGDALLVAYGTRDRPLPAVEVAELADAIATLPIALVDSNDPTDRIADLSVIDERPDFVAANFHGSPDRTLIPYLDPRGQLSTSTFRGVVGGHFIPGASTFDMVAIEPDANVQMECTATRLWRFAGAGPGGFYDGNVAGFPSQTGWVCLSSPTIGTCAEGSAFCTDRGRLLAWPTGGTDLVIGIDPITPQAIVLDPGTFDIARNTPPVPSITSLAGAMPSGSTLREAFAADLDGDGVPELVLAYGQGVLACRVDATGLACGDLIANVPELSGLTCGDAVTGVIALEGQAPEMFPGMSADLVVQCGAAIYRVSYDASGYHAVQLAVLPVVPDAIAVGDVNGDAVADLVVVAAGRVYVYPQLTSREVSR
jgi:hypothetical protein